MTERERTGSAAAQREAAKRSQTPYTVYILRCRGDRLYTGITTDLERRFSEHGGTEKSARFTRAFRPETVAAAWETDSRSAALKLEARIKKLIRREKDRLIAENALDRFGDAFDTDAYRRVR
jgi:putative endonuclease